MKINLNTIIIFTQEIEVLKEFYATILNLKVVEEIKSEWVLLNAGECNIGLHKIGDQYFESVDTNFDDGNNIKLVFEIDTDIFVLQKDCLSKSVLIGEVKTWDNYNYWVCDGKDPEGNTFQLKQKK